MRHGFVFFSFLYFCVDFISNSRRLYSFLILINWKRNIFFFWFFVWRASVRFETRDQHTVNARAKKCRLNFVLIQFEMEKCSETIESKRNVFEIKNEIVRIPRQAIAFSFSFIFHIWMKTFFLSVDNSNLQLIELSVKFNNALRWRLETPMNNVCKFFFLFFGFFPLTSQETARKKNTICWRSISDCFFSSQLHKIKYLHWNAIMRTSFAREKKQKEECEQWKSERKTCNYLIQ